MTGAETIPGPVPGSFSPYIMSRYKDSISRNTERSNKTKQKPLLEGASEPYSGMPGMSELSDQEFQRMFQLHAKETQGTPGINV